MIRFRFAKRVGSAVAALFSLLLAFSVAASEVRFDTGMLTVKTAGGGDYTFTVELAIDDAQRMQGLMHRPSMPADHGMLFDFGRSRLVTMWMRNTIIPLDMLFIDEGGIVRHIQERAVPFSEAIISSQHEVRFVLEINGGLSSQLGIRPGDRVGDLKLEKSE